MSVVEDIDPISLQSQSQQILVLPEEDIIKYRSCTSNSWFKSLMVGVGCGLIAHKIFGKASKSQSGKYVALLTGFGAFAVIKVSEGIKCAQKIMNESEYLQAYMIRNRHKMQYGYPLPPATPASTTDETSGSTTNNQHDDLESPFPASDYTYYPPMNQFDSHSSINRPDDLVGTEEGEGKKAKTEKNVTYAELRRKNREEFERRFVYPKRETKVSPPGGTDDVRPQS